MRTEAPGGGGQPAEHCTGSAEGGGGRAAGGLRGISRQCPAVPGAPRAREAHTQRDRTDGAAGEAGVGVPGLQRLMLLTGPEHSLSLLGHP